MLPYWLLFAIVTLFVSLDYVRLYLPAYQKRTIFFGLIVILVLFAGLRYESDNDYSTYVHIYQTSPNVLQLFRGEASFAEVYGEYLFVFITILLRSFGLPDTALFISVAFLTFFFLYKATNLITLSPFSVLFLYFSMYYLAGGFTQIRFGLATTMSWYGLALLYKGKKYYSLTFLLLACFFHIGAIVSLIVYGGLRFIRLNDRVVYSTILLSAIVATLNLSDAIMAVVSRFMPAGRYESYLLLEGYIAKANQTGIYLYCIITLLFWLTKKYYTGFNDTIFPYLMKTALISIFVGALCIQMSIISRFGVLLQLVFIFVIPMLCGIQKLRYFLYVPLIAYGLLRYAQFFDVETKFIQKYKTVFSK